MSTQRNCHFWKAKDNQWYMSLGQEEQLSDDDPDYDGENDDEVAYGPFATFEAADDYLSRNHSNPGGYSKDDSGKGSPPSNPVSSKMQRSRYGR